MVRPAQITAATAGASAARGGPPASSSSPSTTAAAAAAAASRGRTGQQQHDYSIGAPGAGAHPHASASYGTHGPSALSHEVVQQQNDGDAEAEEGNVETAQHPAHHNALPRSDSYHGLVHRAAAPHSPHSGSSSPRSQSRRESHASSSSSSSSITSGQSSYFIGGAASQPLPSYATFRLTHLLLDLPVSLLILLIFVLVAMFGWPVKDSPYPHRLHIDKILTGALAWIAAEAVRKRLFKWLGNKEWRIISSTPFLLLLHTLILETIRVFTISLVFHHHHFEIPHNRPNLGQTIQIPPHASFPVHPPRPPKGFFRAFDLALGFAAAEILWKTLELLGSLKMYQDVLTPKINRAWLVGEENLIGHSRESTSRGSGRKSERVYASEEEGPDDSGRQNGRQLGSFSETSEPDVEITHIAPAPTESGHRRRTSTTRTEQLRQQQTSATGEGHERLPLLSAITLEEEQEERAQMLVRERKRLQFEESFGCALWEIPIFIVAVWRLDATLLNLALTLFLSLPFHNDIDDHFPRRHPALPIQLPLLPTFAAVVLLHWLLSLLWTLGIKLRRFGLGMPAISYITLLVLLSCFFASLGVWSALV